ncbi:MAG: hypothetical protein BEN18_03910 [Epulopiscium sp. Nuni2H_MBin001]|nr:MAG: hypothetical protein BEN18_03910 [Epulopiscium sp. Nuni2H_MBin001]
MKKRIQGELYKGSSFVEVIVGVLVLMACIVGGIGIIFQMVVEHVSPLNGLLIIIAVTLLFIIRKYLYISKVDSKAVD